MTCEECQPLAIDLARGLPPFGIGGAVQRGDVLSHIARCKRCAQWLAEQEALSEALRAATEADASLSAPRSVEANVMSAWRAHQVQRQSAGRQSVGLQAGGRQSVASAPLFESSPSVARAEPVARAWKPTWPAWPASGFAAAAAVVLLALTLVSLRWLNGPAATVTRSSAGAAGHSVDAGDASVVPSTVAGRDGERTRAGAGARTNERRGESTRGSLTGTNAAVVEVLPEKGSKGRPVPPRVVTAPKSVRASRGGNEARTANELGGPAFVLLPYVEPLRPTEMRHIMRVRMPRAQVAAGEIQGGGLEDATVLADVLVGEDGTARAVRIVQ